MIRRWWLSSVLAVLLLALTAGGAAASPRPHQATVSVGGAVTTPATYSLAQLAVFKPQATFTTTQRWWWGSRTHTDQGVSLEDLVDAAGPALLTVKNPMLRVTVNVSGAWGRAPEPADLRTGAWHGPTPSTLRRRFGSLASAWQALGPVPAPAGKPRASPRMNRIEVIYRMPRREARK